MTRARLLASSSLFVLAAIAEPLGAQSVRPAVVEFTEKASGRFELVNETLFPMSVVLEPRGFRVEESGLLTEVPLDTANIKVKFSAMSFRIPPRQSYFVSYEATAKAFPAWFLVASTMSGARTQSGINVRIELPHVVYLLQKTPLRKADVVLRSFTYDSAAKKAIVELENTGARLGRVQGSEASVAGMTPAPGGGFPLFPHSRRRHEIVWTGDREPDKVVIKFNGFTVEDSRKSGFH